MNDKRQKFSVTKISIMFEAQYRHTVEQMTFILVSLLGKQQVITIVI